MPHQGGRGPAYPVTADWCEAVKTEVKRRKWTLKELAKRVGCSGATMTNTLNGKSKQSDLVPAIHKHLGWPSPPLPVSVLRDTFRSEVEEILAKLPAGSHPLVIEKLRDLRDILLKVAAGK